MANRVAAAALQYSKWLSRFICWTWAIYRFAVLVASTIQPSIAVAVVETTTGMDTIMLANVSTYLVNSLGEKWLYSDRFILKWLDKGGFKHLLNKIAGSTLKENNETEQDLDETEEDNG